MYRSHPFGLHGIASRFFFVFECFHGIIPQERHGVIPRPFGRTELHRTLLTAARNCVVTARLFVIFVDCCAELRRHCESSQLSSQSARNCIVLWSAALHRVSFPALSARVWWPNSCSDAIDIALVCGQFWASLSISPCLPSS